MNPYAVMGSGIGDRRGSVAPRAADGVARHDGCARAATCDWATPLTCATKTALTSKHARCGVRCPQCWAHVQAN